MSRSASLVPTVSLALALTAAAQSGSPAPAVFSAPQQASTPPCPGFTTAAFLANGTSGAIADAATTNFTAVISGAGPSLWDVDITTFLTHTACWDLDISLISPAGTTVVLTTDNGSSLDDVFNGTLWDEDASGVPATDYAYANGVTAAVLNPEGSLTAFRGENPNGTWTLAVTDDVAGQTGTLASWKLDVFTLPSNPATYGVSFVSTASQPIVDNAGIYDTITVSNLPTSIAKVAVWIDVLHASTGDLDITLLSPGNSLVTLTTDNGSFNDNCFHGTWFDDGAPLRVTDATYTNLVTLPFVQAEGAFEDSVGENPNGVWRLDIQDDANGNTGTFLGWRIKIWTCGACTAGLTNYCTAGTSWNGCVPSLSYTGIPSASASSGFTLTCSNLEGQRSATFFYGTSGRVAWPWSSSGSSSFMCVKAPIQRTPVAFSGGSLTQCDGAISLDLQQFWAANPGALGQPLTELTTFQVQAWYRDPPSPKGTHTSNALEFYLCP